MLGFGLFFLMLAMVAAMLGFLGLVGLAAWIAKGFFVMFLILFIFFNGRHHPHS